MDYIAGAVAGAIVTLSASACATAALMLYAYSDSRTRVARARAQSIVAVAEAVIEVAMVQDQLDEITGLVEAHRAAITSGYGGRIIRTRLEMFRAVSPPTGRVSR